MQGHQACDELLQQSNETKRLSPAVSCQGLSLPCLSDASNVAGPCAHSQGARGTQAAAGSASGQPPARQRMRSRSRGPYIPVTGPPAGTATDEERVRASAALGDILRVRSP